MSMTTHGDARSPIVHAMAVLAASVVVSVVTVSIGTPAQAGSICRDGTWTPSEGSGTCSHHGGVAQKGVDNPSTTTGTVVPSPAAVPTPVPVPSPLSPGTVTVPAGVVLPRAVTPGAIDARVTQATIRTTICRRGYTATVRPSSSYTNALKRRQLSGDYAFLGSRRLGDFEEDHLIPLELGGSPTAEANLWPQPYSRVGARMKDRVENRLHALVCAGAVPLATAQQAIASNWYDAYMTYVRG